jgi:histidine triad (HIT) family protein
MSVQECIFCKIIAGQIPCAKLYENDHVLAFLDIGPISEGHTLVVHKQHTDSITATPPEMLRHIADVLPLIAKAVQHAMNADGCNVLCNNGAAAGQVVEHVHFHIIPRKTNDGVFNRWPSFRYPQGRADEILKKIIQNLEN